MLPGGSAWQVSSPRLWFFSAASALIDLAKAFEHPYLWEEGSEAPFPATAPAFPDWCARRAQVPAGGARGDEDGALGRLCCGGRMCTCDHAHEVLFAAVVVDDTQFLAVGKSHHISQQLHRAIDPFTKHAEEVAGPVVSSKKLDIFTNGERVRTDVRNNSPFERIRQPHATVGTWLMLADALFGQDVPQPMGHQHVV